MNKNRPFSQSSSQGMLSPEKQEWALINKFKAMEFERMREIERQISNRKRLDFRKQLDEQVNNKSNAEQRERYENKKYYEMLAQKSEIQRQKEQRQQRQKFQRRRQYEEQNLQRVQFGKMSRQRVNEAAYNLDIGMKSQREQKQRGQLIKKQMLDTLDLQIQQKREQKIKQKLQNQQLNDIAGDYTKNQFEKKDGKVYAQNQKVYEKYETIENERRMKDRQLEMKLVEEARAKKLKQENEKNRLNQMRRNQETIRVKQTLDEQVRQLNRRRQQQLKENPQQHSFQFISNIFKPRESPYDKIQYSKDLKIQAQEQRLRRLKENHMTQQEYKYNLNQLSRAVSGSYAKKDYIDRSLSSIGDDKKFGVIDEKIKDKDADIVKQKIQNLRNRATINYY